MNPHIWDALGEGWLGKACAAVLAALLAWIARRPAEKAAVGSMVDAKWQRLVDGYEARMTRAETRSDRAEARCDEVERLRDEDREQCDRELADMRRLLDEAFRSPPPPYTPGVKP